jgi:predicted dehydrogenase
LTEVPIRVGVVGLGAFGRHHVRHYAAHGAADLVAVADVDAARAGEAAALHGCAGLADWREMIGKVDAVSIAVPASAHAAVARTFIDAGIHVLVEKPLATTSRDASDLITRAEASGVVLQVGHVERFSRAIDELAARVENPRRISCLRRAVWNGRSTDVDVVLDMMIHDIGHVLMLAGSPPVSVSASGRAVRSGSTDEAEAWLTFAGGLIATLSASRVAGQNERKMVVTEPGVTYTADLAAPGLTVASRAVWNAPATPVALPTRDNLAAEIDAFLSSVATGAPPVVDGHAGLAAVEVAERIQAAIADADVVAARSFAQ